MMLFHRVPLCLLLTTPLWSQLPRSHIEARPPHHVYPSANPGQPNGLAPQDIKAFYGIDRLTNQGQGQTIAIINAYDHPAIEADLATFSAQYGLPACTGANGCFRKVYQNGAKPTANTGWALEISLDVEWAHAIAPRAKILLIEAQSSSLADLFSAVDIAVRSGAPVVSMSFGITEFQGVGYFDNHFNVRNVVFTAASGDNGHGVEYPAASPFVVGVGGTVANLASGAEVAWAGSGGGQSIAFVQPGYQMGVQNSGRRGVPDVAYHAEPNTGFAVFSSPNGGWLQVGGTSAGTPQWAALFAIANSMRAAAKKFPLNVVGTDLYQIVGDYREIATGANGNCGAICSAGVGYDFITGLGAPRAELLVPALVAMP